ncbi:MAG: hypothetical protein ABIP95_06690 [Pelobium sp.]
MMNKQQILRKIGEIIQELNEQHQYLKNTEDINLLELELFTANADFLIDHIEILKKLSANLPAKALEIESKTEKAPIKEIDKLKADEFTIDSAEVVEQENEAIEEKDEEIEGPMFDFSFDEEPTEMVFDFEKKIKVEEVFDRELSEEEREFLKAKEQKTEEQKSLVDEEEATLEEEEADEEAEQEEEGPEPFLVAKEEEIEEISDHEEIPETIIPVKETPIETPKVQQVTPIEVQEKRLTLNEMLSAKLGNKPSGASGSKGISDLKVSISLNDKMIFIKELFNGYNLAYSEAIEIINRFESFEAADNFLQKNYAVKNDWENKHRTVDRLYEYLNKKFVS